MFKFFIDRPILSACLSTLLVVLGLLNLKGLPLASYPRVSPPTVSITALFPGADAATVSESVAAVLERQINGAEGMLYISSKCFNNGYLNMAVTFDVDRDDDMALVDVQNRVAEAQPLLPQEVMRQGLTVRRQSPDMLMLISLFSPDGRVSDLDLANYASRFLKDDLARIDGVGDVQLVGAGDYGMRLWLDPERLSHYGLTVGDVRNAVNDQNSVAPAGAFGAAPSDARYVRTGIIRGRLSTPEEFGRLVVRTNEDGGVIRLMDVTPDTRGTDSGGRAVIRPGIELGAEAYDSFSRLDGRQSASLIVYQLPTGNAVEISRKARETMAGFKELMVRTGMDIDYNIGLDTAEFVTVSLNELVITLFEALLLVLLVVYLFLGSLRSSLVPLVAVPVSLIGVFAFFPALGLNINSLTLFALVLAVGIVVDDAIVVVEAVEVRLEEGLPPREAAELAMRDVGFSIIGITFALISVFLPMTLLGGLTGKLYAQFALTLSLAVAVSAFNSLTLSPAICALLLRVKGRDARPPLLPVRLFNVAYRAFFARYSSLLALFTRRGALTGVILLAIYLGAVGGMKFLPTSLVPGEDQKVFLMTMQMPNGTSQARAVETANALCAAVKGGIPEIETIAVIGGMNLATGAQSSSVASLVVQLKHWEERKGRGQDALTLIAKAQAIASEQFLEPLTLAFNVPTISGLGVGLGLTFEAENRGDDQSAGALAQPAAKLWTAFAHAPELSSPYTAFSMQGKFVNLDIDREKAKRQGVNLSEVYDAVGTLLGGSYINDFQEFGRTYKVKMQASDEYRVTADALRFFRVRAGDGSLAPVSSFVTPRDTSGPEYLTRYNLYPSVEFMAAPAPGRSSGEAMAAMEKAAEQALPSGFGFEWTGQSYQERLAAGKTGTVLVLAFVCCFLVLAGLYESFTSPVIVMLSVAVAVCGAVFGQLFRGLSMDVFMQVGLVMLIGLAAKNAILIVQFAQGRRKEGLSPAEAAEAAGRQRIRPILMTSFAFILGVLPLVIASGAGANARHSLGTGVFCGMLAATAIGVFLIPGMYALAQGLRERIGGTRKA
ncbi:MAG: efflux RND transporter permease subunit [Deltaproteobacteria bacterium]|jgi:hydrophobe/amphiphile efflux-1 (HAE1) family protein|nr:efflux RND transporter permease subunit [Deltaproteobacteria bacterium]